MNDERMLQFLSVKLNIWETYHNHKENMSNAGFLVQLGLFSSIITGGLWPPKWVTDVIILPELATFLVYFILWFLIHYYTRWQLINKRIAALYFSGFENAFLYFSMNELSDDEKYPNNDEAHKENKIKNLINKIIYIPGAFQKMDATTKNLPMFIAREINNQFKKGTGGSSLEILITFSSFVLLAVVTVKIFFS